MGKHGSGHGLIVSKPVHDIPLQTGVMIGLDHSHLGEPSRSGDKPWRFSPDFQQRCCSASL